MFTSNYRIAGKEPNAIGISQGVPKGWKGKRYLALAPPWELVKDTSPGFTERYYERVLKRLDPQQVKDEIEAMAGPEAILLCWEAPGKFCHRMVVAEWLRHELGIEVKEWIGPESEPVPPSSEGEGSRGRSGEAKPKQSRKKQVTNEIGQMSLF